ncbi:MAG: NADH-quinone oxidoreductase subunit C [Pyrinomonadaceae bacterium]
MNKFSETTELVAEIKSRHESFVADVTEQLGEFTILTQKETIADFCEVLKSEFQFNLLSDLCGADHGPEVDPRFEVIYHLFSTIHHKRIRLKVLLSEDDAKLPSVTGVWKTANWHERETYDLVGIVFENHPDLRRILLPSDFDGHALRKDYPLRGYEPYSLT